MRIERTGAVERLTPRVEKFLRDRLRGISLDEVHSPQLTRIDYSCLKGLVAVELKTLEGDPSERTNNFVETLRERDDFPTFFGEVPLEAAFKNMNEPDKLRLAAMDRVGRTIVTHMKKADDQLARHSADYPRRTSLRLLLLINEDHPEYDPETVAWIVRREFARTTEHGPRYSNIDAVLFLTERHGQVIHDLLAFPISAIHGPATVTQPWKENVLDYVCEAWARWQNRSSFVFDPEATASFETIEHISDEMPHHEMWRVQYRRRPYLRGLTDDQLRDDFDEVMLITTLWGLKGSPMKFGMDVAMAAMERFGHIQIEMHDRALPMERFDHELDRQLQAAKRLNLPQAVFQWLQEIERERVSGH